MFVPPEQIWMMVVGFLIAFVLAFGLGANDVANTFGSSVGSGVLTLKQACILATLCEMSGAVLLGAKVSNTLRKGIVDVQLFDELPNGPAKLMAGQVAALGGSCIWLLVATFFRLPVSGTHSIVGATVGFSLVIFGFRAIQWIGLVQIVASWFISPLFSGLVSVGIFYLIHYLVLIKEESYEPGLRVLPGFYGAVVFVNAFSIVYGAPPSFHFDRIPLWGIFILSAALGCITVVMVKWLLIPYLRERFLANKSSQPEWAYRMCHQISRGSRRLTACCPKRVKRLLGSDVHSDKDDASKPSACTATTAVSASSNVNGKQHDMALVSDSDVDQNATEMHPIHPDAKTPGVAVDESPTPSNGSVCGMGDAASNNAALGRLKMQRIKQLHSSSAMPARSWAPTTDSPRVFEVTPARLDGKAPGDHGNGITTVTAFSVQMPNVEFADGTMSVTKRTFLAQPSLQPISEEPEGRDNIKDRPSEARVFSLLQVMTAVFGSFAHGGNDVSNAIGPLIGLWIVGATQQVNSKMPIPIWLLVYGGIGISVGLCLWGRRVIQTLGEDLARITPSSGVCIEIGSALTVLLASKVGLPVSTTHCQVGSVVGVGRARSRDNVNWAIFRNIIIAWVVTVPAAAGMSALLMYCFTFLV